VHARDALCKALYGAVFKAVIEGTNVQLQEAGGAPGTVVDAAAAVRRREKLAKINVLDIFGFESLATNSFEQLCINYCNEKLQNHFNEHIFKLEQQEYAAEGVEVPDTAFVDNAPCLALLDQPQKGAFAMIDEEMLVPRGSDAGFVSKLLRDHAQHPNLERPRRASVSTQRKPVFGRGGSGGSGSGGGGGAGAGGMADGDSTFVVAHFAGKVSYTVEGFLEKNKDALHDDIAACTRRASVALVAGLAEDAQDAAAARGRGERRSSALRKASLGKQFIEQLGALMLQLQASDPHFIRCVKSNTRAASDTFEAPCVLRQLRYAGLLAVVTIRKLGFGYRWTFGAYLQRFGVLMPGNAGRAAADSGEAGRCRNLLEWLQRQALDEAVAAPFRAAVAEGVQFTAADGDAAAAAAAAALSPVPLIPPGTAVCGATKVFMRDPRALEAQLDVALGRFATRIQVLLY